MQLLLIRITEIQMVNLIIAFWPANAPILPHAFFINRLSGILAQGDDADDSVMILLASDNNESDNTALKRKTDTG